MDKNRIYTVKEVARLLGFSTNTIYKYLDEGKIKSTRLGSEGRFRIPQKEVARLLGLRGVKSQIASDLTPEEIRTNPDLKSRSRTPIFLAVSMAMYLLLFTLGIRNINISRANSLQPLPTPEVLSETEEAVPTEVVTPTQEAVPTEEIKSTEDIILKIRIENGSSSANIHQIPTTDSEKIGEARDGDTFKYVYLDSDWYEVRLDDGSTGFISREFIVREETEEAVPTEEIILKVTMEDPSASVNIRQGPTIDSEKIGKARDGDTFEYVSIDSDWYEVRLIGGTTGFISREFIEREETDK